MSDKDRAGTGAGEGGEAGQQHHRAEKDHGPAPGDRLVGDGLDAGFQASLAGGHGGGHQVRRIGHTLNLDQVQKGSAVGDAALFAQMGDGRLVAGKLHIRPAGPGRCPDQGIPPEQDAEEAAKQVP